MDENPQKKRKSIAWRWVLVGFALALFITWLALTPEGLLGKADAVGYAVCHRISARTFFIGERPGPMCARCSGMFLGALLGLTFQITQGRKGKMPPILVSILFGLMALAWGLDGVNSFTMLVPTLPTVYQTTNLTRLITGTGMGLAVSAILYPSFVQTMFTNWEEQSPFGSWKQVLGLLLLAVVLDILILLEIPWVLYPLSVLSSASVLVLLTLIYSMVLTLLFKKDNTYEGFNQLLIPLVGGFILALLQVGAIDLARYLWTGTWEGFTL
jgi:uncharacterized membrane protein